MQDTIRNIDNITISFKPKYKNTYMQALLSYQRQAAAILLATGALLAPALTMAANIDQAAITIKTKAYETSGVDNLFTICFDTNESIYIDVDCGFGAVEYEIEPSEDGTWIPCVVSEEGIVRMYTDHPEMIRYMYCQGGHITDIDLSQLRSLEILDLSNNELGKIDLSNNKELNMISLGANPFDVDPLYIGDKPNLVMLELEGVGNISEAFNLSAFPEMISFSAFSSYNLNKIDTSGCPKLQRLSVDVTNISSIDVSNNPELRILNVSDTPITEVDVTHNSKLQQLYVGHIGSFANKYKLTNLDISKNPALVYLFAQGNALKSLDISNNPNLIDISIRNNYLEEFDCSNNRNLYNVDISKNCLDFATLPLNPPFGGEYYYQQLPMKVELSYPVGATLDLSDKVLREGTNTSMRIFACPKNDPVNVIEIPANLYEYSEGKITFNKEYADSVYVSFTNPDFPACELVTTNFMIKTKEAYGKPILTASFSPQSSDNSDISFSIGIAGASESNPKTVYVDFGNGDLTPVEITAQIPDKHNVIGTRSGYGAVGIYVNDNQPLTSLAINDCPLYDIELTDAPELRSLELTGTELRYINLERQRCLQTLKMTGNNFGILDLTTDILGYNKNVLSEVNLSGNQLHEIIIGDARSWKRVDISHNNLEEAALDEASEITDLDISFNKFTEFDFTSLDSLTNLNIAGNYFSEFNRPARATLKKLDCRENSFTFGTLPYLPQELSEEYLYAPQRNYKIGNKGPNANLSGIATEIEGNATEFVWKSENGNILIAGEDYAMTDGKVRFLDYEAGNVYCTMTNPAFPDFADENALRTSTMLVAAPPTNEIGWMDVAKEINEINNITLIGTDDDSSLYIDWGGEGKFFDEYLLSSTYRVFKIEPEAGTRAKIYTYDDSDFLKGFSLRGLHIDAADFSAMKGLTLLTLDDACYQSLIMPDTDQLQELSLDNNGLSELDCSRLGKLRTLSLLGNNFRTFDLTPFPDLEIASLSYNGMNEIKIDNPLLWDLDVSHNDFETFSFKNLPSLHQASLANNRLTSVDINGPRMLRGLMLDNNRLNYQTLPVPTETLTTYTYGGQASLPVTIKDMTIDLSWLYDVHGEISEFYWCQDEPYLDEEYGLVGRYLEPEVDYIENEGVTTFLHETANVCGVILSPVFPKTYLLTELIDITSNNVGSISSIAAAITVDERRLTINAPAKTAYAVADISGHVIASGITTTETTELELPSSGVYVVKAGKATMKVAVK